MLSKKEIRKWLLKNCIDGIGDLNLSGLDFSGFNGDVKISHMKVKRDLVSEYQNVGGSLFQGHQKVGKYLFQGGQIVGGHLKQNYQKVKGNIYQNNQSADRVLQDENSHSILDKEEKEFLEERLRPFKDEIGYIIKDEGIDTDLYRIRIEGKARSSLGSLEIIHFSWFKGNTMYQGMEPNRDYTLEELGLFKNN